MKLPHLLLLLLLGCALAHAGPWTATTWHNEQAYAATSDSGNWVAIVSVERGRLVHLGATTADADNLILFTPSRDDRLGWGGHRAWLGPQTSWPAFWPPPDAWEKSAAKPRLMLKNRALVLQPPATGIAGWPNLSRGYQWRGESLSCTVAVEGPVNCDVQVVQIIQIPTDAVIEVDVEPTPDLPNGYIQLGSYFRPEARTTFEPPEHVGPALGFMQRSFKHVPGEPEKFGFKNRALVVRRNGVSLTMRRGEILGGDEVGEPENGFNTQIFFGGSEPFVEIEQLSPLLRQTGRPFRSFGIALTPRSDP